MQEFFGEHLRRAIVLDEPAEPVRLKIQALNLYEDGVIARWVYPGPNAKAAYKDESLQPFGRGLRLQDDTGTRYIAKGGHAGGAERLSGETVFVPAVPSEATSLQVLAPEYSITTALR
jgi:hypothetical protein